MNSSTQGCLIAWEVIDPWITGRTSVQLARSPLSFVSSECQAAFFGRSSVTSLRSVSKVTTENRAGGQSIERLRIAHPVDELLAGNKVNVRQSQDGINELEEAFLTMGTVEEPGWMEKEGEWCLVFGVTVQKVLSENLLDGSSILFIITTISHGTGTSTNVLQGGHGNFPHSCKLSTCIESF